MLGELPSDFLRIHLVESQIYDPFLADQENHPNPNFLGHFTLTIAEVGFFPSRVVKEDFFPRRNW